MPRVRIPNASLIASADLSILPFLAPRVFTDSPILRRRSPHNGNSHGLQKETEEVTYKTNLKSYRSRHDAQTYGCSHDWSLYSRRRDERAAAGPLRESETRWSGATVIRPRHLDRLYADISSYTRQHARVYSTAAAPVVRRAVSNTNTSPCRGRKTSPKTSTSILARRDPILASKREKARRGTILASKREKALALERKRLSDYVARLPPRLTAVQRMQSGQYRSINRRVFNLQHWNATKVDMRELFGCKENEYGFRRAFPALDRAVYSSLGQYTRKITIIHDHRCVRWSANLFPPGIKTPQIWTSWMEFDVETRRSYPKLLLYLLDRKPARALQFIQVLANDKHLQGQKAIILADALGHLSKIHSKGVYASAKGWSIDAEANKRTFIPVFIDIFNRILARKSGICSQDLLYNLVGMANSEDLKKLFDCLIKAGTRLGFDTLLHYANAFGKAGEVQYALRCLDELKARHSPVAWDTMVNHKRLRWSCALILRKSMSKSYDYHETPRIVAAIVRLGVKLDILLYNVVMHNAMDASDYTTAFRVYNALEGNGLQPDLHTLAILLQGCTTQSNPAIFRDFAEHCAEVAKTTKDSWLATGYLHYIYICHEANPDVAQTTTLLWQIYLRFFSATTLEPFTKQGGSTLRHVMKTRDDITEPALLEPPTLALYIMLQMEIRAALAIGDQRVFNLYEQFQLLVKSGANTALTALAKDPIIWNAFLLAFCKRQQLASASKLLRDMMDGPTQPNVYSWNIFMEAFFQTGQVQAAVRAFEIMQDRGVEPDQFTYGVLLRVYAKAQLVERIGDIMHHVDTEEEMNPVLLKALTTVVDRNSLMLTLEKVDREKKARALENAKRSAEEERERWNQPKFAPVLPESSNTTALPSVARAIDPEALRIQPFQEPSMVSQALSIIPQEHETTQKKQGTDAGEVGSFLLESSAAPQYSSPILQEPSPTLHDLSSDLTLPQETTVQLQQSEVPSASSPPSAKLDPYDPELLYRRLQEQLGVTAPTLQSHEHVPGKKSKWPGNRRNPLISKPFPKFKVLRPMSLDPTENETK